MNSAMVWVVEAMGHPGLKGWYVYSVHCARREAYDSALEATKVYGKIERFRVVRYIRNPESESGD